MRKVVIHQIASAALAVLVAATGEFAWPAWVLGILVALVLYVILVAGTFAGPRERRGLVSTPSYVGAVGFTATTGVLLWFITDSTVWWPAAAIMGSTIQSTGDAMRRESTKAAPATSTPDAGHGG